MRLGYGIAEAVKVYDDTTENGILWSVRPRWGPRFWNGDVSMFFWLKETCFVEAPPHFLRPDSDVPVATHGP